MSRVAALILAGGAKSGQNRALTELAGRPMLDYVVEAVRGAIGPQCRLLVAGDVPLPAGCVAVAGGASMVDTLLAGTGALAPSETQLLVVTADIPFLTVCSVVDFLEQSQSAGADFCWPIVRADVCAARFPGMKRTVLRLAEGTFTGGNLALLDPAFLRDRERTLQAAYARRKSVVGLARLLGPPLLLRLAASRFAPRLLSVVHAEQAVERVLGGARVRAIESPFPEIAADVDRPEDVALAQRWLSPAGIAG